MKTLDEFWPYYVSEHLHPVNRRLHFAGTSIAVVLVPAGLLLKLPFVALAGVLGAYGLAWIGHFFFEKNRPATFKYPLLSLRADFRMYRLMWTAEMDTEILLLMKELRRLRSS